MSNSTSKLPDVSDDTLLEVPARALKFLLAVGTSQAINAALSTRGYDRDDHDRGWSLLHAVAGYEGKKAAEVTPSGDAARAVKKLDDWDEEGFTLIEASWQYSFPEQYAFVTAGGLHAERGSGAVRAVKTLLDRLDAIESSPERAATREQDHAALALLARRRLNPERRAQLRALLAQAERFEPITAPAEDPASKLDDRTRRLALYAWLSEWSLIARSAIRRRDHLIQLGLAKPRSRKDTKDKDTKDKDTEENG